MSSTALAISMELDKFDNRETIVDDIKIYIPKFLKSYIDIFYKYNSIIVYKNNNMFTKSEKYGAGFPPFLLEQNKSIEIVQEIETDDFIFPDEKNYKHVYSESDIHISRWPNGKHYYAKVGATDVIIENQVKWSKYDIAYENAKIFMNKLNIENEKKH